MRAALSRLLAVFGLLRLFVISQTMPSLPPRAWVVAAPTASPRSVSARAPPGLRAVSRLASALVTSARVPLPTVLDTSARGDGASGCDWLKAASTSASPGWATASASSVTSGLKGEPGSL